MSRYHKGVLRKEVLKALNVRSGEKYIDCTLGGGDHTKDILESGGVVLGLDRDEHAVSFSKRRLRKYVDKKRLYIALENFENVDRVAKDAGFLGVAGVLYDLGMSSFHIDGSGKGFSYRRFEERLDMRMGPSGVLALDLINGLSKRELETVFRKFGQVGRAGSFAKRVVAFRKERKISTVGDLLESLGISDLDKNRRSLKIAKKVFLALRVAVNDELNALPKSLPRAVSLLRVGGRIVIISYHSLEDRIAKEFALKRPKLRRITKKPITPSLEEISDNSRAKSAKMRVYEVQV